MTERPHPPWPIKNHHCHTAGALLQPLAPRHARGDGGGLHRALLGAKSPKEWTYANEAGSALRYKHTLGWRPSSLFHAAIADTAQTSFGRLALQSTTKRWMTGTKP